MNKLMELRQKRGETVAAMRQILDTADKEKRDLTDEETAKYDALDKSIPDIDKDIAKHERLAKLEEEETRNAQVASPFQGHGGTHVGEKDDPDNFRCLGEFIHAVRFYKEDKRAERKLVKSNTEYREHYMKDGSSGGFMVPKTFMSTLLEVTPQEAIFRPRANVIPAGEFPDGEIGMVALDQTSGQGMLGGVSVEWTGEGATSNETNMKLREISMQPQEVTGHMIVTDKLLRNWSAADAIMQRQLRRAVMMAEDNAFFGGNGVKKPLGLLNSNATINVNRTTANSIVTADINTMLSNIYDDNGAVFIANRKIIPRLYALQGGNNENLFVMNASAAAPATLMGYPVIWNQTSPTLGSKGDLMLVNLGYYNIKDGSGIFVAASEHVFFRNNKTVIKIIWNVDGKPWLTESLAMTDFNGSAAGSFSPFVVLDVP